MEKEKENIIKCGVLSSIIISTALSGHTICTGSETMCWKTVGDYVYVLIQECSGKWNIRLFICKTDFKLDINSIHYPSVIRADLQYVYDYLYDISGFDKKILRYIPGEWEYDLMDLSTKPSK